MDQDTLRLIIRRKLANGGLPHNNIPRIGGGPGSGEECDACQEVIRAGQLLMEGVSATTNQGIQLHVECFYVWDRERDAPGRMSLAQATDSQCTNVAGDELPVARVRREPLGPFTDARASSAAGGSST